MTTCNLKWGAATLALAAALGASVSFSRPAFAQAEDQAAARSLFEEGRRLLKKGQYPEACEKLEAAGKLYASSGILLNLGDCYDKLGKTASAWTEFGEAAAVAARSHRSDQEGEARRRQAAEEPRLTRLKIHVATEVPGLAITRDGTPLASAAWGTAIPVDPGSHEIRAEAPGHEPWSTSVTASAQGQTATVEVPELTVSPTSPVGPSQHDAEAAGGSAGKPSETSAPEPRSHTLDWVLIGAGAAVGITGGVLWGVGSSNSFAAKNENSPTTSAQAKSDYNSAQTLFYAGIIGVAVGAVAAGAGVVLLTTSGAGRSAPTTALRASPWVSIGTGGVALSGAW